MLYKRLFQLVLVSFFMVSGSFSSIPAKEVIVLDPGHGGKDSGAVGYHHILEKEITLNIAREVVRLNKVLFNNRFNIYLTRYNDTLISLSNRTLIAKKLKASLFVSIHCNAMANDSFTKGMEVYVAKPLVGYPEKNLKESIAVGLLLSHEFSTQLNIKTKGLKFANFQVLRASIVNHPSVLIETAFVSNKIEAEYIKERKNITAIALAILSSMDKHFTTH